MMQGTYHSVYFNKLQPIRIIENRLELWDVWDEKWKVIRHACITDAKIFKDYGYPILTYAKTWVEPYEGMEE